MNDSTRQNPASEPDQCTDSERTKQVTAVAWLAGIYAVVAGGTLVNAPTWPVAFGLAAVAVMVAFIGSCILKRG